MSRTRLLRPGFVKDADLYQAEIAWHLPLRVAFAGLWTVTDREGRFPWKPMELKPDVLPYDLVDFAAVLDALEAEGFVERYSVDGRLIGVIPSFTTHQTFHKSEPPSHLPAPVGTPLSPRLKPLVPREDVITDTDADAVTDPDSDANCSVPRKAAAAQNERVALWGLIRTCLWVPDGLPPTGWTEAREGSILTALQSRHPDRDVAAAIQGVAVIRDFPGQFADRVDWLTPNSKATLRVLYNTRSGVLPMFTLATNAFWKRENTDRDRKPKGQPESVGDIARRIA